MFRGEALVVSCAEPAAAQLGSSVELDAPDARFGAVREVVGERPTEALALRASGGLSACPDAEWVLALRSGPVVDEASAAEAARLTCHVPAVPSDERCAEGGPFWFGTDPSRDGTAGDGRSAVWIDGREPEPGWRSDPLEVAAREVGVAEAAPAFYALRRVGLRVVDEQDDQIVIEALYQQIVDGRGSIQREHHTLSRLDGRAGWYQTAYIVAEYGDSEVGTAELDKVWAAGVDRVLTDVDRRTSGLSK
jgi:hypothetical protein